MHGQGTKIWANGSKYVGLWKNGKRHGEGTITLANGCIDNGIWDDDELVTEKKCKKGCKKKKQESLYQRGVKHEGSQVSHTPILYIIGMNNSQER